MTLRRSLIASLAVFAATPAAADPMILLTNAQVKCMSIEAPADALLNIEYEAPDLISPEDLTADGKPSDPRMARKFRTTITVAQDKAGGGRGEAQHNRNQHGRNVDRRQQQDKVVKDLDAKRGSIEYVTQKDGQVSICVQSLTASAVSPTPISLRVTESPAGEEAVGDAKEAQTAAAAAGLDSESQKNAKAHFSQMEKTLTGLISKTDMILRQADYAKELEVEFHEQSIAMNKASQWWPIVQLCVLLVTGFTQANHMVQFFRKHHIF